MPLANTKAHTKNRLHTKQRLSTFAKKLLGEWRRLGLPEAEADVIVGVSGGADSSALLLALEELITLGKLRLKITVAHLDHGLRKESRADARWVKQLVAALPGDFQISVGKANLQRGRNSDRNLEQAARIARYDFFQKIAKKTSAKIVLTAHTIDDQAETILMRLLRGSAAEGLSGIPCARDLTATSEVQLVRPLVSWAHRRETEDYCRARQIDFRADKMNDDETFSRVRVRKQLLPLLKSFNPKIVEALSRTAALLVEDVEALSAAANELLRNSSHESANGSETKSPALSVDLLLAAPLALRRRALRAWILGGRGNLRRLEMVHLIAVEKLLAGGRGGRVAELPGGMKVTRKRGMLQLSDK